MTLPRWAVPGIEGRARPLLAGAVVIGVLVATIALATRWILFEQLEREVDRALQADVDELREVAAVAGDGEDGGPPELAPVFDRYFSTHHPGPEGVYLGLVDGRPHVRSADAAFAVEELERTIRDWARRQSPAFGVADTPAGPLRHLVSPITSGDRIVGTFVAGRFLDSGRARANDAVRTVAVVSAAILGLALAGGMLLARQRPRVDAAAAGPAEPAEPAEPGAHPPAGTRADEERSQLLAGVSRELVAVSSVVRLHLDDAGPGQALSGGSMRVVRDELSRMGGVAEDLRLLADASADGFLHLAPVDVVALASDVGERARGLGERTWEVLPRAPVVAHLDAERIRHAWLHLVRNAVEHTWRSDRITLFADVVGSSLELGVADGGRGIDPDDVPSLFEPFRRGPGTARASTAGGGLGLTVARTVAEAHGGTVAVRETAGGGATVVLCLPLGPDTDAGRDTARGAMTASRAGPPSDGQLSADAGES